MVNRRRRRPGDTATTRTAQTRTGQTTQPADSRAALGLRAQRFAALGEPVRLAIVDQLLLGDAAPSELGALVDLPSNLLAHHLKVLDDAGITRRVRSEGDRRRSYVQLRLDDVLAALLAAGATAGSCGGRDLDAVRRVVFVCTHNSARSQLAAAAWTAVSDLPATSAGTHPAGRVHPRAVRTARRHGLDVPPGGTRHLDAVASPHDLLVAVCDNAYEALSPGTAAPAGDDPRAASSPVVDLHWSVPDPARVDTDDAFEAAYTDLDRRVTQLASRLGRRPSA